MDANQAYAAAQPGFNPYAEHADTAGFFSSIGHFVSNAAKTIGHTATRGVHDLTHPKDLVRDSYSGVKLAVAKGLPIVQTVLKNAGPIGMVASGAISAMKAGLSGKNLESIAWAAAEGATPSGIDKAISAAESIRHGANIGKVAMALKDGLTHFTPGSSEAFGFATAVDTLKKAASKAALGVARNALPGEGARRAFDAAIGVASGAVDANGLQKRAMSIANISLSRGRTPISAVPSGINSVMAAVARNPGLTTVDPHLLAQKFGVHVSNVNDALQRSGRKNLLPWRSMSPHAVNFIRRYAPNTPVASLRHLHTDIGGLDVTGTKYIVEKGDGPWAIAQKLTGNGNRWTELKALNADKKPTIDKNIWVGEQLNLPASWQKPAAKQAPPPVAALPAVPLPSIGPLPPISQAPSVDITPSIIQGKSILVAWSKTDGVNQAGLPDYGANVLDLTTTMGPRDTLELAAFQNWNNKTLGASLNTSGNLDAATLTALQAWAEARATAALPGGVVAGGTNPPLPAPVTIPTVIGGTTPVVPQMPSIPRATPTVAPANAGKSGGGMGTVAIGAVAGGLLFGLPGALIGAAGGAALS